MSKRHEKTRIDEIIGMNIVAERKSRNISREELAGMMELTASHLGLIERGERGMTAVNLSKLSKFLDIPVDRLFENSKHTDTAVNETYDAAVDTGRKKIQSLASCLEATELDFVIHTIKGIIAMNIKQNMGDT